MKPPSLRQPNQRDQQRERKQEDRQIERLDEEPEDLGEIEEQGELRAFEPYQMLYRLATGFEANCPADPQVCR